MFNCTQNVDNQTDIQAQKDFIQNFDIASNAGDFETLASFYTEDAVRMPQGMPAWIGKKAIRDGFKKESEQFDFEAVDSVENVQVFGDLAFMRGSYTIKLIPKNGGEPIHEIGKWMSFRKRQPDGSWKTASDIYNTDLPFSVDGN